jgi:DNA polymerase-3 subunit delta
MSGPTDKAVAEIGQGRPRAVYLLHGDEWLTRTGAKAIVDALVAPAHQAFNVEILAEDRELASLPLRLRTLSLFGGRKVVVVHDSRAFLSKGNAGKLFGKSLEAWADGDADRAARLFLQAVGAAGQDAGFLEAGAKGGLPEAAWGQVLGQEREPEALRWVQEVCGRLAAAQAEIPAGGEPGRVYEELIRQGLPPDAVLVLTTEVVDQRRVLWKLLGEHGAVIDCGVRAGKAGETQMRPELARAKVRELAAAAGKSLDDETLGAIVERTGFSMRSLVSEVEKILLYIGARPRITTADALAVLSSNREAGLFDLTNALDDREGTRALAALRQLLAQREPAPAILGLMASEVRNLLVARCAIESRLEGRLDPTVSYSTFQARVLPRLAGGDDPDGSGARFGGMHPFRAYNLLRSAARFSRRELLVGLSAIHDADLALKTSGQPDDLTLEPLVLRLAVRTAA